MIPSMTLALDWPPGGPSPTPGRPTSACCPHNIVSGHKWEELGEGWVLRGGEGRQNTAGSMGREGELLRTHQVFATGLCTPGAGFCRHTHTHTHMRIKACFSWPLSLISYAQPTSFKTWVTMKLRKETHLVWFQLHKSHMDQL